ncbi:MAG: hypothetical protein NTW32_19460 [Chloroflexi bacterium]|nr:hypothetical protein [Chloroflexota bacterium]
MNITNFFINVIGWAGAALVLIAYGLLSIEWMNGKSISYQTLNVAGALLLVINSYYLGAYPSVGVNIAWVGIAALTLFRDWWKGSAEAYKKVTTHLSKRQNLRKITLQRIKLPILKHEKRFSEKQRAAPAGFGQTQLS